MGKLGDVAIMLCPMCGEHTNSIALAKRAYIGDIEKNPPVDVEPCDKCKEAISKAAKLMCSVCDIQVAWLESGKTEDGMIVEERGVYHTTHCKKCRPNEPLLEIIEFTEYLKNKGEIEHGKQNDLQHTGE